MSEYASTVFDELERLHVVINDAYGLSNALKETGNEKLAVDLSDIAKTVKQATDKIWDAVAKEAIK